MACLPVSENVQYLIAESITRRRAADSTDSTARRDNEVRLFFLDWYERFQGADTRIRRLFAEQGFQECSKCRMPVSDLQFSWSTESFQMAIGCDGDAWL